MEEMERRAMVLCQTTAHGQKGRKRTGGFRHTVRLWEVSGLGDDVVAHFG